MRELSFYRQAYDCSRTIELWRINLYFGIWKTFNQFSFKRSSDKLTAMADENDTDNTTNSLPSFSERNEVEFISRLPQGIKIFQTIQEKLAEFGISRDSVSQSHPCNGRISMGYFLLVTASVSNFVYMLHGAQSFEEYTQSSFYCSLCITIGCMLTMLILKAKKLFEMITNFENIVNASK